MGVSSTAGTPAIKSGQEANEFYVKEIISSNLVNNPHYALGKQDDKYAEIMPGGELVLKMEKPFLPQEQYNDGKIIAKDGEYSVAALVQDAWREIFPGVVPGGFKIPKSGQVQVDTLKILNIGNERVYIDSIVG